MLVATMAVVVAGLLILPEDRLCANSLNLPVLSTEWSALAQRAADTQVSFADFLTSLLETLSNFEYPLRTQPIEMLTGTE